MWSLKHSLHSLRIFGLVQKKLTIPSFFPVENLILFPLCLPLLCPLLSLLLIDTLSLAHVLLPSAGGLGREQAACLHMGPYTMLVPNEMMRGVGST
jgi:hypothetical protein